MIEYCLSKFVKKIQLFLHSYLILNMWRHRQKETVVSILPVGVEVNH